MKVSTSINKILSLIIIIILWKILSNFYPEFIVPKISQIYESLKEIFFDKFLLLQIRDTLIRLLIGVSFGIILAIFVTIISSFSKIFLELLYPIIEFLQVIPPISFLILAILWFGINGKPAIMIVSISIFCIMSVSLINSIKHLDKKLLEVAKIFRLNKLKKWKFIILPALYPSFKTALIICLGTSVKLVVMAEVLTISSGIGGEITNARLNIETEKVIAWTLIIVILYHILGGVVKLLSKSKMLRKFWFQKILVKNIMKK